MSLDCDRPKPGDSCQGEQVCWTYVGPTPASNGGFWHVFISGNTLHLVDRGGSPVAHGQRAERILRSRGGAAGEG